MTLMKGDSMGGQDIEAARSISCLEPALSLLVPSPLAHGLAGSHFWFFSIFFPRFVVLEFPVFLFQTPHSYLPNKDLPKSLVLSPWGFSLLGAGLARH